MDKWYKMYETKPSKASRDSVIVYVLGQVVRAYHSHYSPPVQLKLGKRSHFTNASRALSRSGKR